MLQFTVKTPLASQSYEKIKVLPKTKTKNKNQPFILGRGGKNGTGSLRGHSIQNIIQAQVHFRLEKNKQAKNLAFEKLTKVLKKTQVLLLPLPPTPTFFKKTHTLPCDSKPVCPPGAHNSDQRRGHTIALGRLPTAPLPCIIGTWPQQPKTTHFLPSPTWVMVQCAKAALCRAGDECGEGSRSAEEELLRVD